MAIGWYIAPYKIDEREGTPSYPLRGTRYCEIFDFRVEIETSGGKFTMTEVLGNRAIVKVRASQSVLDTLNINFKRIPKNRLNDALSDLPQGVKTALRNEILDMGYTVQEVQARFGNDLGQYTLKDVLKFMATRRIKPRYDAIADDIILDGIEQQCRSIESVDGEIT